MRPRGFTLLELIVVIAIIGVLSVVILPSFTTALENSRLASAKRSAAAMNNNLGTDLASGFDFNECSGTNAINTVSNVGNGTLTNGPTYSTDTPLAIGSDCSVSFDGVNDYVALGNILNGIDLKYKMSVTLWFKTNNTTAPSRSLFSKSQLSVDNTMFDIYFAGADNLIFRVSDDSNNPNDISSSLRTDNKWHFLAATWDNGEQRLYIDGKIVAKASRSFAKLNDSTGNVFVGATDSGVSGYFSGLVDSVKVYSANITAQQIQKLYAEGLASGKFAER